MQLFQGYEVVGQLEMMGVTHVVWVPDSDIGQWESALGQSSALQLLRVCREGEAWPLAAGLLLGGQSPVIMMQTTGLFESGDALRNIVYDLRLPVFALIGARNWIQSDSPDSARRFATRILDAWEIDWTLIASDQDKHKLSEHFHACTQAGRAGAVVLAE